MDVVTRPKELVTVGTPSDDVFPSAIWLNHPSVALDFAVDFGPLTVTVALGDWPRLLISSQRLTLLEVSARTR